ncbi:hypothetical protein RYX36_034977 [Vicia faba]
MRILDEGNEVQLTLNQHSDNFPFKLNYVSLRGEENMRILDEGNEVQLTLNQHSGSGFTSRQQYGSGVFNMKIRMPIRILQL